MIKRYAQLLELSILLDEELDMTLASNLLPAWSRDLLCINFPPMNPHLLFIFHV